MINFLRSNLLHPLYWRLLRDAFCSSGKIEAVVDFKPSQLAQEIANLIDCFCANKPIPEFITIHPCLIPHNIEEADGYEVISRCLMCQ